MSAWPWPDPTNKELKAAREDLTAAEQAMWDARKIMGFDNDGDPTPAAAIAGMGHDGFRAMFLKDVHVFLADMGDLL